MDTSLLKADIFFFVATIGFTVITILFLVGLFYILGILRSIRDISQIARQGAKDISEGIHKAKENFEEDGYILGGLLDIFKRMASKKRKSKK